MLLLGWCVLLGNCPTLPEFAGDNPRQKPVVRNCGGTVLLSFGCYEVGRACCGARGRDGFYSQPSRFTSTLVAMDGAHERTNAATGRTTFSEWPGARNVEQWDVRDAVQAPPASLKERFRTALLSSDHAVDCRSYLSHDSPLATAAAIAVRSTPSRSLSLTCVSRVTPRASLILSPLCQVCRTFLMTRF